MKRKIFCVTFCVLLALFAFGASGEETAEAEGVATGGAVVGSESQQPEGSVTTLEEAAEDEPAAACRPLVAGAEGAVGQEVARGNWDPATCGGCGDFCSSDNACFGRLLGDRCSNSGGTCQAFTGCALFNCCRCV